LELRQGERAVVEDHRGGVMGGYQGLELALVARKPAVQVERRPAQPDAHLVDALRLDAVLLDQIEQRGVHALDRRGRWPQAQRELLQLPARAEIGRRKLRLAAVRIGVEEAAVLGGEELARRDELLLGEQRGDEAGERAAALMELDRGRAPGRVGAGRLA